MSEATTTEVAGDKLRNFLQSLAGDWTGISKTWFEPNKMADESPISATFQLELEGRFAVFEYHGTLCGDPLHGKLTIGYNDPRNRVETAWIDGFHMGNGILFSVGDVMPDGFSVLGSYPTGEGSPDWGWRTQLVAQDSDHLTLRSFNIPPDGQEVLGIETVITRT